MIEREPVLQINFTPFPALVTGRLILRQLTTEDADAIFFLRSDEKVNQYIDRPKANTIDDAIKFINKINHAIVNNESIYWAISQKNNKRLMGTICLWNISKEYFKAEIGYELHPAFQGKGVMQEAVSKVIEFGFTNMKLEAIEAFTHADNERSAKLLERNNFKRNEGETVHKEVIYSLSRK